MLLISHRGNLSGPNPERENNPDYIQEALDSGLVDGVEIDVWYCIGEGFYLGHDKPQYEIEETFLENDKFWCHAKNTPALEAMIENDKIRCFWNNLDVYALTNKGELWLNYASWNLCGIKMMDDYLLEFEKRDIESETTGLKGICTDYIVQYRELLKDV